MSELQAEQRSESLPNWFSLLTCELQHRPKPEGASDLEPEPFYTVTLTQYGNGSVGTCEMAAGQRVKDTAVSEFTATYVLMIRQEVEARDENASYAQLDTFTRIAVWQSFRFLFASVAAQGNMFVPHLPMFPDRIQRVKQQPAPSADSEP